MASDTGYSYCGSSYCYGSVIRATDGDFRRAFVSDCLCGIGAEAVDYADSS